MVSGADATHTQKYSFFWQRREQQKKKIARAEGMEGVFLMGPVLN